MGSSVQPPYGYGNPLGAAGVMPRTGPCAAGRNIFHDDEAWKEPCGEPPVGMMVIEPFTDEGEHTGEDRLVVLLCAQHRDLLEEILLRRERGEPS